MSTAEHSNALSVVSHQVRKVRAVMKIGISSSQLVVNQCLVDLDFNCGLQQRFSSVELGITASKVVHTQLRQEQRAVQDLDAFAELAIALIVQALLPAHLLIAIDPSIEPAGETSLVSVEIQNPVSVLHRRRFQAIMGYNTEIKPS